MEWDVDCTCPVCGEDRDSNLHVWTDGKAKCKTCGKIYSIRRTKKPRSINTEIFKSEKAEDKKIEVISGRLPKEVKEEEKDLKKSGARRGPRKAQDIIDEVSAKFHQEMEQLKEENKLLKSENELLKKENEELRSKGPEIEPVHQGFTVTSDGQTIRIKQPSGLEMAFSFDRE